MLSTPTNAIGPLVGRALDLTPAERRRLGRWTSASLRDPRISRALEGARQRAILAVDESPDRRRAWDRASAPLHRQLVESAGDTRRWRIVMLAAHLAAVLAIVSIPNGLPVLVALALAVAAPFSAWAAWGRGTARLGAIHAALAVFVADRIADEDAVELRRAWAGAIEAVPPLPPPRLGLVGALAPSGLLLLVWAIVTVSTVTR